MVLPRGGGYSRLDEFHGFIFSFAHEDVAVMNRDREVMNCTRSHVKTQSKRTNLMKIS